MSQPGTFGSPEVEDPNARPRTTTIQMPARAAAKAQPLLTPEQANDIIERARNGEFSKVNSAPNQQFLDQLAALNQASLQMNATANALNASAMNNAAVKPASLDANLSMIQQQPVNQPTANQFPSSQSSSNRGAAPSGLPPFHVPTTGMSSSLLPGMPSGVSTSSNFGLQVPSQSQNQSHSQ